MDSKGLAKGSLKRTAAALAVGLLVATTAHAGGTKYQANVVNVDPMNPSFALLKPGKLAIKSTIAPTQGGLVTQLNVSNINCPPNNDLGIVGKCGPKASPITNHVMELGTSFAGVDTDKIAGIKFQISQGKTTFMATGKNTIGGGFFGALVTIIYNKPLGIGIIRLHQPGSDPTRCDHVPLISPTDDGCLNGNAYAIAGVTVGSDTETHCTANSQCTSTAICNVGVGLCETETCTVDGDCDQGGGTGTHQCGDDGKCCDPALDATCAGQVP